MKFSYILAATMLLPSVAAADGFEVFILGNSADNGSQYSYLSLRAPLNFGGTATESDLGLRLRLDVGRASYDTDYDGIPGTGQGDTYRLLLSYGFAIADTTTLTVTGGVSQHSVEVRPVSASSPADTKETAEFVSLFLEHRTDGVGLFQGLIEHDGAGADYAALTYMFDVGARAKVGPTANYLKEGDYTRSAYGLSATYLVSDNLEFKATAAEAQQSVGSAASENVSYFELMLRAEF